MEAFRSYLISVIAAAIVCWIAMALTPKTGTISSLGKLLTGIFMAVTIFSPVISWQLPDISAYAAAFSDEAADAVACGKSISNEAMSGIIKQQCEAYILDKAAEFGAQIHVVIIISTDVMPVPCGVEISGEYSPYARLRLEEIISSDLGVEEDAQVWIN